MAFDNLLICGNSELANFAGEFNALFRNVDRPGFDHLARSGLHDWMSLRRPTTPFTGFIEAKLNDTPVYSSPRPHQVRLCVLF